MEIIVGKTAGFCYGVKRSVEEVLNLVNTNSDSKIYCLGELVHNNQVLKTLEEKGVQFIENIDEANSGTVVIRAHGIDKNIYKELSNKNINIFDYTCPNVLAIHKLADEYAKIKYYIFLIGEEKHPEIIGTASHCGNHFSLITSEEDINGSIEKLLVSNMKNLLIISQTTFSLKKFEDIVCTMKTKLPKDINILVKNTICNATETRQKETEQLSNNVDVMIIIGGKKSSNTHKLYEIAKANCAKTISIETKDDIENSLSEYNQDLKIGIMAGASTPQKSIDEVVAVLSTFLHNEK